MEIKTSLDTLEQQNEALKAENERLRLLNEDQAKYIAELYERCDDLEYRFKRFVKCFMP